MARSSPERGCSETRESMLEGRSKHFPGRLTPIINGGSLNPLQEAEIGGTWRDGLMGRDVMLPAR